MIYLDNTAIFRLIYQTTESADLGLFLQQQTGRRWFGCTLSRIQVSVAISTLHRAAKAHARQVFDGLDLVNITDRLITAAATLEPLPEDPCIALHLAAALTAGAELTALVTYDDDLARAGAAFDIPTIGPGRP